MEIEDALADDVSPTEFFEEKLPGFAEARADRFERYSEVPLRVSVHLTDIDQRYSFEFSSDGLRATEGEFIEFPVVTLEGSTEQWETVRRHTRELFQHLEAAAEGRPPPPNRLTRSFLDDLERHDGIFEIEVRTDQGEEAISLRFILNDYTEPPRAKEVQLGWPIDVLYDVTEGRRAPAEAARNANMSGDLSLAFDIGGLLMSHFPELEGKG